MHKKAATWKAYHKNVNLDLWGERGITEETVNRWGLGFCIDTPYTADPVLPSLTIPVYYQRQLYDIRHRVIGGTDADKYRSHLQGLIPIPFNIDGMGSGREVIIVEGEIKAIYLMQAGIPHVTGYPGVNFLDTIPRLISRHVAKGLQEVVMIPDPGSEDRVMKILEAISKQGYKTSIVPLVEKPDDLAIKYGIKIIRDAIRYRRMIGNGK